MPILVGLDGERERCRRAWEITSGITEAPGEMFGKIMSISDELMWQYYELLTDFPSPVVVRLREEVKMGVLHPMDAKMQLAHAIIAGFHGEEAAKKAGDEFQLVFRDRQAPTEIPEMRLKWGTRPLFAVLTETGLASSRSEAERLIKQGASGGGWASRKGREARDCIESGRFAATARGEEEVFAGGRSLIGFL